jgi:hypothetical protein
MTLAILPLVALVFIIGISFQYLSRRKQVQVGMNAEAVQSYH